MGGIKQGALSRQVGRPNRKMAFSYWHTSPNIALIRLQITNSIRKASGDSLAYDLAVYCNPTI